MSRYFQGLAQRSGLLAPLATRSSVAGDLVEQDVTTTVEAPSMGAAPTSFTPTVPGIAQPAAVLAPQAVSSPVTAAQTVSRSVPAPAPASGPVKEVTHIVTTEHFSQTPSAPSAAPVGRPIEAAGPESMTASPAQRAHASTADSVSAVTRIEVSNINTTNIVSDVEESVVSVAAPIRAGNTTRAHVLPETDAFGHPHSSSAPVTAAVRTASRAAPSSIDVRIGAIKLDIHQAAPHQRPAAAPVARAESRRDTPRFAPRRYYLSGW